MQRRRVFDRRLLRQPGVSLQRNDHLRVGLCVREQLSRRAPLLPASVRSVNDCDVESTFLGGHRMKVAVVVFPGSNADWDALHVARDVMGWDAR